MRVSHKILRTKICPHCGKSVIGKQGSPVIYSEITRRAVKDDRKSGMTFRALNKKYRISMGMLHKICTTPTHSGDGENEGSER